MLPTRFDMLTNGRRLRFARLGSGPPLILLHGYPDNLQIWCELAPRLAQRFEVIAFDWPGMGYSDPWPGGATPALMVRRLLDLLDHWGIQRANVVGMDMGGQPALVFAATYPDRIDHLVVLNSLVFGDEPTSWEIKVLRKFGWNRLILRLMPVQVFRRAERTFLPGGTSLPRTLREDLWQSFRQEAVRAFIVKMCAGYQGTLLGLPQQYGRIQCPTLALWGESDKHFPLDKLSGCTRRFLEPLCRLCREDNTGWPGTALRKSRTAFSSSFSNRDQVRIAGTCRSTVDPPI